MQNGNTADSRVLTMLALYAAVAVALAVLKNLSGSIALLKSLLPALAAAAFILVPLAAIRSWREKPADFGLSMENAAGGLALFACCSLAIFPLFTAGNHLYQFAFFHRGFHWNPPAGLFEIAVMHLVLAAVPEEVFYRGFVQTTLNLLLPRGKTFFGAAGWPSIFAASGMFALGHFVMDLNPARLAVFFPSILFGWMRERSGSVFPPALMHAAANVLMAILDRCYR